jgi:polyisoprenoid-binding protein YceI
MNRLFYPLASLLLLAGSAFTFLTAQEWQIADGYSIGFSSNDAAGIFRDFKGLIQFDEADPAASRFDVTIMVASINTGNGLQNQHAKSAEWFDATRFPVIRYISRSVVKTGTGFQVTGDLEVKAVKKPVSIPFTFQKTAKGAVFQGTFTVNRNDYQVGKPGGDVAEDIKIEISVPVIKK